MLRLPKIQQSFFQRIDIMKKIYIVTFLSAMFLASCGKKENNSTAPEVSATVQGRIAVAGEAISFASIKMDNEPKWNVNTGQTGTFQFYGVPNGGHTITVSSFLVSGGNVTKTIPIEVKYGNVDLGTVVLSGPPNIAALDSTSRANSVVIKWNALKDAEFKEYSVYRKNTSSVDEASSELIFHSTSVKDTVFSDSYASGVTKYYRVYARTASGSIYAGSASGVNIPPEPLLANGNFEATRNGRMPDNWTYNNNGVSTYSYINLSTNVVKEGKYSLQMNWTDSLGNYSHMANLYQKIKTASLLPGKKYKFSFWIKSFEGKAGLTLYINDVGEYLGIPAGQDWTELSYTFVNNDVRDMRIEIIASGDSGPKLKAWIDDMKFTEQD